MAERHRGPVWLLAAAIGCLAVGPVGCGKSVDAEVRKADHAYEAGDNADAVAHYEAAIALAEEEGTDIPPQAWVNLARAYEAQGETARAMTAYRRAMALDNSDPALFFAVGQLQEAQGDLRSAAASYNSALSRDPTNAEYLARLRATLEAEGLYEAFVASVRESVAVDASGAGMLKELGLGYLKDDHVAAGVSALEGSLALDPEQPDLYKPLGMGRLSLGRYAEAASALAKAVKKERGDAALWGALGEAQLVTGDAAGARQSFGAAVKLDPAGADYAAGEALAQHRQGESVVAVRELEKATRRFPDAPGPWVALARVQLDRGQLEGARRAMEAARAIDKDDPRVELIRGLTLMAEGKDGAAIPSLRHAAKGMPGLPEAAVALCRAESRAGKGDAALDACRDALELVPGDPELSALYADRLIVEGRYKDGIAAWEGLSREHPADLGLAIRAGELLLAVGSSEEAMAVVRRAQGQVAGAGELDALLAEVQQAMFQAAEADASLRKAAKRAPRSAFVHGAAASWYADQGKLSDARRHLAEARELAPGDPVVQRAAVAVQLAEGDKKGAARAAEALVASFPADLQARLLHARALEAVGRDADAKAIREALEEAGE